MTVVIPTRNRLRLLQRTLSTALAQQGVELEVVVVDEASRDDTPVFLAEHPDPRVRTIRHDAPRGIAAARNAGIAAGVGKWIAFLDDDDLWSPLKLRTQLDAAHQTGADVVYVAGLRVDGELRPRDLLGAEDPEHLLEAMLDTNRIPGSASSVMASRPLIEQVGGFDQRLARLSDWDLWLRLIEAGRPAACDQPLMAYVVHGGSTSLRGSNRACLRDLKIMSRSHRQLSRRFGRPIGGDDFWDWIFWSNRLGGRRIGTASVYVAAAVHCRRPTHLARAAAALAGPPIMDFGVGLADRVDRPPASPPWLDDLRARYGGSGE